MPYINGDSSGSNGELRSLTGSIKQTIDMERESQTGSYPEENVQSKLAELEARINNLEQDQPDKVPLEKLYGPESNIIKARDIMRDILDHISQALTTEDELASENQIDLIWNDLLDLQFYMMKNPISTNLDEGITMVQTALYNHRKKPLTRNEIVTLNIVFSRFRDNIKLPEDMLDSCLDKMEEVGFDISSPMTELDTTNGSEG